MNNFDNMVCEDCGSNHISINMYFNVWQKRWFDDDPHFWCHKCNSGDGNYCDVEWYAVSYTHLTLPTIYSV